MLKKNGREKIMRLNTRVVTIKPTMAQKLQTTCKNRRTGSRGKRLILVTSNYKNKVMETFPNIKCKRCKQHRKIVENIFVDCEELSNF